MSKNPTYAALERAIEIAGGQAALARAINVSQPTIGYWLHEKGQVPGDQAPAVAKATGVPLEELRPDLWGAVA